MSDNLSFVNQQKTRILARIQKYTNIESFKEQLSETGDLTPYFKYKNSKVLPKLMKALKKIEQSNYGFCEDCGLRIDKERLIKVPAAECCSICQKRREKVSSFIQH